jgi:hypothetical protein
VGALPKKTIKNELMGRFAADLLDIKKPAETQQV